LPCVDLLLEKSFERNSVNRFALMFQVEACTPTQFCVRATATGERSETRLIFAVGAVLIVAVIAFVMVKYHLNQ